MTLGVIAATAATVIGIAVYKPPDSWTWETAEYLLIPFIFFLQLQLFVAGPILVLLDRIGRLSVGSTLLLGAIGGVSFMLFFGQESNVIYRCLVGLAIGSGAGAVCWIVWAAIERRAARKVLEKG